MLNTTCAPYSEGDKANW